MAQFVEHCACNVSVMGSIPTVAHYANICFHYFSGSGTEPIVNVVDRNLILYSATYAVFNVNAVSAKFQCR